MHHGAKNSACRYTPPVRCAIFKTSDKASIPSSYHHLVFRSFLAVERSWPLRGRNTIVTQRPDGPSQTAGTLLHERETDNDSNRRDARRQPVRALHPILKARLLGHRRARHSGALLRRRPQVPPGWTLARRRIHDTVARREAVCEPDPGPHLRQYLWASRAVHQRQNSGAGPRSRAWRPGGSRSASAVQCRGAEAPGLVSPHRCDGWRGFARRLSL